jgi:cell division protein FtsZ
MMGRGEASGEKRVLIAAKTAISNPLIEDPSIKRASGLLISITGGRDLTLFEVEEAATRIREEADQDANIIVGATFDDSLEGIVRVSVVATGIDNTSVTRQPQAAHSALTNLAEKLQHDSPTAITPSLPGLAQQNEIRTAPRKERGDSHPQRAVTLMQRMASVGLGRRI